MQTPEDIHLLFAYDLQLQLAVPMPDLCRDAEIATRTFVNRSLEAGSRLKKFIDAGGLKTPGRAIFGSGGCYSLEFDSAGKAISVTHLPTTTSAQVPSHIYIDTQFQLVDNHLDQAARVQLAPSQHYLHTLFPPSCDFKNKMQPPGKRCKVLVDFAETASAESLAAKQQAAVAMTKVDSESAAKVQKQKSTILMSKARAGCAAQNEARKKRRIAELTAGAAAPLATPPIADASATLAGGQ